MSRSTFGHALEQVDRRRPLLDDVDRDLAARACPRARRGSRTPRRTDRASSWQRSTVPSSRSRRNALSPWVSVPWKPTSTRSMPLITSVAVWRSSGRAIVGALHHLRADHHVGVVALEELERALVEVGVAQIDLVADDELAARAQDALAERLAVVGLAERVDLTPADTCCDSSSPMRHGAIARAVLRQQDLVVPPQLVERGDQIDHRRVQDALLVVDGDDDRLQVGRARRSRVQPQRRRRARRGCESSMAL